MPIIKENIKNASKNSLRILKITKKNVTYKNKWKNIINSQKMNIPYFTLILTQLF